MSTAALIVRVIRECVDGADQPFRAQCAGAECVLRVAQDAPGIQHLL